MFKQIKYNRLINNFIYNLNMRGEDCYHNEQIISSTYNGAEGYYIFICKIHDILGMEYDLDIHNTVVNNIKIPHGIDIIIIDVNSKQHTVEQYFSK